MRQMSKMSAALFLTTALCLGGCTSIRGGLLSTHDEVLVGVMLMREIESRELLLANEDIQEYVDNVGHRLVRVAKRQHIPYTFKVLDNDDAIDAFALPGGYFYVTTGFLRNCANEAELAGLMAHELAHVIARHHGQQLSKTYGARLLRGQLLGSDALTTRRMTLDILDHRTTVHFNERQEREADRISTDLMIRAGYDARALPSILLSMYERGIELEVQPEIFSGTFQPTPERLDHLYSLFYAYPEAEREGLELLQTPYRQNVLTQLD